MVVFGFLSSSQVFAEDLSMMQKMFKPLIEIECNSELKTSKAWKTAAMFMSSDQQSKIKSNVCGCVSEQALKNVSAKELLLASVSDTAKHKLVSDVVLNSMKGCASQAFK